MLRRLISTLLLASYAVSQLAALPHAHASQEERHDQRPHLHASRLASAFTAKGDSRPARAHHHHGHDHSHSHRSPEPAPLPPAGSEHDDDCVYLPYVVVSWKEVRMADEVGRFIQVVASCQAIVGWSAPTGCRLPQYTELPACDGERCALYLTLRTLRI